MTVKKTKKRAGEGVSEGPKKVQKKVVGDVVQQVKKFKPNNNKPQQPKDKKPEVKVAVQQKKEKPVKSEKPSKPENGVVVETKGEAEEKKGQKKPPGWRYSQTKKRHEMGVETLAQKIEEIKSRSELTRSAKRKLSAFKKLLAVKQGTYVSKQNLPQKKDKKNKQPTVQTTEGKGPVVKPSKAEPKKQPAAKKQQQKLKPVQPESESEEDESMSEEEEEEQVHKSKLPKFKGTLQGKQTKQAQQESDEDESGSDEEDGSELNDDSFEAIVGRHPALKGDSDSDIDEEESDGSDLEGEESENEEMDESAEDEEISGEEESEEEEEAPPAPPAKSAPKPKVQPNKAPAKQVPQAQTSPDQAGKKKRFVLFVGNLSYTTTTDEIRKHFSVKIGKIQDVRIPTIGQDGKHKGFAYVELTNPTDYEKGLSLHNTFISGRKINVQYSDSGHKGSGKKSEVVAKNKKLQALRQSGKLAGSNKINQNRKDRRNKQKN